MCDGRCCPLHLTAKTTQQKNRSKKRFAQKRQMLSTKQPSQHTPPSPSTREYLGCVAGEAKTSPGIRRSLTRDALGFAGTVETRAGQRSAAKQGCTDPPATFPPHKPNEGSPVRDLLHPHPGKRGNPAANITLGPIRLSQVKSRSQRWAHLPS